MNRIYSLIMSVATVLAACSDHPSAGTGGSGGAIFHDGGSPGTGGSAPCSGCITPTFACEPGNTEIACGHDGQSCESCALPHASGACVDGSCSGVGACDPMWLDCDGKPENGCETPMSDNANCGACGHECIAPQMCGESCMPPNSCVFLCL